MPSAYFNFNGAASNAHENYVRQLELALRNQLRIPDPSYGLGKDQNVYDVVLRDTVVASAVLARRHRVAGTDWHCEPASAREEDEVAAQWMEDMLGRIDNFESARFNLSNAVFEGSRFAQIQGRFEDTDCAGIVGRFWVPTHLADRSRLRMRLVSRWSPRPDNRLTVVLQTWAIEGPDAGKWVDVSHPEWYVKHVYDDAETALGYGRGIIDNLYHYAYAKTVGMTEWCNFIERWAQGFLVYKPERNGAASTTKTNADIVQAGLDFIAAAKARHGGVIAGEDTLELLDGPAGAADAAERFMEYLDRELRVLIVGSNVQGDAKGTGSYAMKDTQAVQTDEIVSYDRRLMSGALTRDLCGLVWAINQPQFVLTPLWNAKMPKVVVGDEVVESPSANIDVLERAHNMGLDVRLEDVYSKLGLVAPGPTDAVLKGAAAPSPSLFPGAPGGGGLFGGPPSGDGA